MTTLDIERVLEVLENRQLSHKTWVMKLQGPGLDADPGQFVNLMVEGFYLRRPISICDCDAETLTLLYDTVGEGTEAMSRWLPGQQVNVLLPLGKGFDMERSGCSPLLAGGGIGVAPLFKLCRELVQRGARPVVALGFNTATDVVWAEEFKALGVDVFVATIDGSMGTKGFVTDIEACMSDKRTYYYACGPLPMLKALWHALPYDGEMSLESRMGCGFGVCMCCSLETADGAKRICKDGPVFRKEELIWK